MSSTDPASRSGSREVRLRCVRLGPVRVQALIATLGLLRVVRRCQSGLSGAPWRPAIARRSPASGTSVHSFLLSERLGARLLLDAGHIRTATATRWLQLPGRCTSTAHKPTKPLPSPVLASLRLPLLQGWPILGEWSAGGGPTGLWSRGALAVIPRSSASAQPVAPGPRLHEMDRGCTRASIWNSQINYFGTVRSAAACGSLVGAGLVRPAAHGTRGTVGGQFGFERVVFCREWRFDAEPIALAIENRRARRDSIRPSRRRRQRSRLSALVGSSSRSGSSAACPRPSRGQRKRAGVSREDRSRRNARPR